MRVLVVGATGMLGHTVFRYLSTRPGIQVFGTLRDSAGAAFFSVDEQAHLISGVDVLDPGALDRVFDGTTPDVVINCVGVIKQLANSLDPLIVVPINALVPHQLSRRCAERGSRLIQIGTDCVFDGTGGGYRESDKADSDELYGQSKHIGEVRDAPHAITLRTSIVGHELASHNGLLEWFLSQEDTARGYTRAIFSGLPTIELARVLAECVLPRPDLCGLYHLSAAPISKFDLLQLVAAEYGKAIRIIPDDKFVIDRSLNSERFSAATGYAAAGWADLVKTMHESHEAEPRGRRSDV
jgi:dTDP-4-dehydrorhamnose reductase